MTNFFIAAASALCSSERKALLLLLLAQSRSAGTDESPAGNRGTSDVGACRPLGLQPRPRGQRTRLPAGQNVKLLISSSLPLGSRVVLTAPLAECRLRVPLLVRPSQHHQGKALAPVRGGRVSLTGRPPSLPWPQCDALHGAPRAALACAAPHTERRGRVGARHPPRRSFSIAAAQSGLAASLKCQSCPSPYCCS